jgi:hypothetical protein
LVWCFPFFNENLLDFGLHNYDIIGNWHVYHNLIFEFSRKYILKKGERKINLKIRLRQHELKVWELIRMKL